MRTSARILLVEINRADAGRIQADLRAAENPSLLVQSIEQPATALARISGGGVDLVVLNISLPGANRADKLSTFRHLRAEEPQTPVLILADREDEQHALHGVREGAAGYVIHEENPGGALLAAVRGALEKNRSRLFPSSIPRTPNPSSRKPAAATG